MQEQSADWQAFQDRYARYRSLPVWGVMNYLPDAAGQIPQHVLEHKAKQGANAAARVRRMVRRLETKAGSAWPPSPRHFVTKPESLELLRTEIQAGLTSFRNFWDALVFDRDGYTCRYCGRDAFAFYEATARLRTLWLVVDHLDSAGKSPGIFALNNSVTACWACNTLKGPLPESAFLMELDSSVEARRALRGEGGA
jgi:hypothetical protein